MRAFIFGMLVSVVVAGAAWGQASDAALRDRVNQLVEKLDASKVEARKAAEDGLIKLGPRILPFLPELPRVTSAERKQPLDIIAKQAEVTPNFYTGDGSIGLMAGKPAEKALVIYSGPFRIAFRQFTIL